MEKEQDNTRCIFNFGELCPEKECLLRAQSANTSAKIIQELSNMSTKEKMTEKEMVDVIKRHINSMGESQELKKYLKESGLAANCFLESKDKEEQQT